MRDFSNQVDYSSQDIQQALEYQNLKSSFYFGMRNELNPKRLFSLVEYSKNIQPPKVYGLFNSERHYLDTLWLMLRATLETRHRGIFINRVVLPQLQSRNALLDIGPGDGQITRWASHSFNSVTLVDPNQDVLNKFDHSNGLLRRKVAINKIHSSVLDLSLAKGGHNLALLSQVLYYICEDEWLEAINLVYRSIQEGGILVIALSGDAFGKAELISRFGGKPPNVDKLARLCLSHFGPQQVSLYSSKEYFVTYDFLSMLHIAGLFLNDASVTASRNALESYIYENFQRDEAYYEISTQQKFITISKNSNADRGIFYGF